MGFRTVVINSQCKLSYKNDYLQVKGENLHNIHLSEIDTLLIESTQVNITAVLLCELTRRKIKIVFCDEKHNPYGEITPYYSCHNSSKKIAMQTLWGDKIKQYIGDLIIAQKIRNQAKLLEKYGHNQESQMLYEYATEIMPGDSTNREGHAAKVYFNALFGKGFSRENVCDTNAKLDYGYTILLSSVNREVSCCGCLTQLGIKHKNEFNQFNLSSDIMEVFRVVVDEFVVGNLSMPFDKEFRHSILSILSKQVILDKEYYLTNAIGIVVKSIIDSLNYCDVSNIVLYRYR